MIDDTKYMCKECGCYWRRNGLRLTNVNTYADSWSLWNDEQVPQPCCDNNPNFMSNLLPKPLPCRRCSECEGHHHWLESCDPDRKTEFGDPWVGAECKHCNLQTEICLECDDIVWPNDGELCCRCEGERRQWENSHGGEGP